MVAHGSPARFRRFPVSRLLDDPLLLLYAAFVATIPISRWPVGRFFGQGLQASDVFLACLYAVWGIEWLRGRAKLRIDPLLVASVAYLSVLALSIAVAHGPRSHALKLVAYVPMVLLPALTARLLTTEERWWWAMCAWVVGALVAVGVGVVGIVAFYVDPGGLGQRLMDGYGGLPLLPVPRLTAPFANPNMFANYLVVAIAILLGFGSLVLRRRWLVVVVALACGVVATLTLSAGFGGFMLSLAVSVIALERQRGGAPRLWHRVLAGAAVGAALFFTLASIATLQPHGAGTFSVGPRDVKLWDGTRPPIWRGVMTNVQAHPILGIGYGSLVASVTDPHAWIPVARQATEVPRVAPGTIHLMEAHNVWLSVLGQAGAIGLGAFLFLLLVQVRQLRHRPRSDSYQVVFAAAFLGAFAYQGLFAAIEEARHMWALFGLVAALRSSR
jgi:O-antigen ligase